MTRRPDPSTLPRVTPSKLGDQSSFQPRRRADHNGVPDPRNAFRRLIDPPLLATIVKAAAKAHIADATPHDWRDRVREILIADLDARFPAADMIVLARHECSKRIAGVTVLFQRFGSGEMFEVPPRDVPIAGHAQLYRTSDAVESTAFALVPPAALPFFEARDAARADVADLADAQLWPSRFAHQHKRPPTWAEIEEAFPRIGAWMASKRERA